MPKFNSILRDRLTFMLERLEKERDAYRKMAANTPSGLARDLTAEQGDRLSEAISQLRDLLGGAAAA